ncbi:MAG: trypsin-like peptidase domain-containing protein [bacterium]|nr:trypsin-like peptidase domain-containing protein [bacterium]
MQHSKPSGEIITSLLSGLAGVIIGVIIVITVVTPILNDQHTSKVQPPMQAQESSKPVRSAMFGNAVATDTKTIPDAVAKVAPAVVTIDTTTVRRVYERGLRGLPAYNTRIMEIPKGMGTGVIVSTDGKIVTNNHVVEGANTINVTLNDRRQYTAKVLGMDKLNDIAILKITDEKPFPVAELSSSDNVRIGEWVVTIGNPLGVGQTVTVGVLSARGRHLSDNSVALRDLLQTDAAINPGNSGGPLVSVQGRVIGINTAIIPSAQGIGFAIPAESVSKIIENLNANGRIIHAYLGVELGDLTPAIRRYLELPRNVNGVVIGRIVKNGPAHKAGLTMGDVIISIDGQETASAYDLQGIVRSLKVGDKVKIRYIRDNQEAEIELTLEESPLTQNAISSNPNIKAAGMER